MRGLPCLPPRSPETPLVGAGGSLWSTSLAGLGQERSAPEFFRRSLSGYLAGLRCPLIPATPRPLPEEAAELLTPGGGDGREGNQAAGGGASPAPGPSPRPRPKGRDWTPARPKRAAGEGRCAVSFPAVWGRVRSTPTTPATEAPPRVGLRGTPSPAASSARSPGRPRSPAAGNSRSSPSSRRCAQPGLPRLPEGEPHAGRPRGPPSLPPSTTARQPRWAGRGPGWPPLPAPRAGRNAWQPLPGAILSGKGAAQPRCFRLFPGPRPAS